MTTLSPNIAVAVPTIESLNKLNPQSQLFADVNTSGCVSLLGNCNNLEHFTVEQLSQMIQGNYSPVDSVVQELIKIYNAVNKGLEYTSPMGRGLDLIYAHLVNRVKKGMKPNVAGKPWLPAMVPSIQQVNDNWKNNGAKSFKTYVGSHIGTPNEAGWRHSQVFAIDLDLGKHGNPSTPDELKAKAEQLIAKLNGVLLAYQSPSGGVKILIRVEKYPAIYKNIAALDHHRTMFKYIADRVFHLSGLTPDPACSDVTRLQFLCPSDWVVFNPESGILFDGEALDEYKIKKKTDCINARHGDKIDRDFIAPFVKYMQDNSAEDPKLFEFLYDLTWDSNKATNGGYTTTCPFCFTRCSSHSTRANTDLIFFKNERLELCKWYCLHDSCKDTDLNAQSNWDNYVKELVKNVGDDLLLREGEEAQNYMSCNLPPEWFDLVQRYVREDKLSYAHLNRMEVYVSCTFKNILENIRLKFGLSVKEVNSKAAQLEEYYINYRTLSRNKRIYTHLAGFDRGFHRIRNANRNSNEMILVTESPLWYEGEKGDWSFIRSFFERLFKDPENPEQIDYMYAWLKLIRERVVNFRKDGNVSSGSPILYIIGDQAIGKTLLMSSIVAPLLGKHTEAGYANGSSILSNPNGFNSQMLENLLFVCDDNFDNVNVKVAKEIGSNLKSLCYSKGQEVRIKYQNPVNITAPWAFSILSNIKGGASINCYPYPDEGDMDKFLFLFASAFSELSLPNTNSHEREIVDSTIAKEIPAFIYFLENEYVVPESIRPQKDHRSLTKGYLHPRIKELVIETTHSECFLTLVEDAYRQECTNFITDENGAVHVTYHPPASIITSGIQNGDVEDEDAHNNKVIVKDWTFYNVARSSTDWISFFTSLQSAMKGRNASFEKVPKTNKGLTLQFIELIKHNHGRIKKVKQRGNKTAFVITPPDYDEVFNLKLIKTEEK